MSRSLHVRPLHDVICFTLLAACFQRRNRGCPAWLVCAPVLLHAKGLA